MSGQGSKHTIATLLRRISLFRPLQDRQIRRLAQLFTVTPVEPRHLVLVQGEAVENFIVVCSGELVMLRTSSDGRERVVASLRPGMHFGLAEMITGAGSAVTIRTEAPSNLGVLYQGAFRREVLANPKLCYALMQTMARSIFHLVRELEHTTFESVPQRLARCLLALAASQGIQTSRGIEIFRPLTHQDLARLVGASRETITRALGTMQTAELVEVGYRRIILRDREGLERQLAG